MEAGDIVGPLAAGGALGLAAGGAARLGKHVIQALRRRGRDVPDELAPLRAPVSRIPVEVSPEEAAELERKGLHVKQADDVLSPMLGGAALVGGAYGGWTGLSSLLNARKKERARATVDKARLRVQNLLDQEASPEDQPVANAIKVAEDQFVKQAFSFGPLDLAFGASSKAISPLAMLIGAGGAMYGIKSYRDAAEKNKQNEVIKALKSVHRQQNELPGQVVMEPVLRRKPEEAAEPVNGELVKQALVLRVR